MNDIGVGAMGCVSDEGFFAPARGVLGVVDV